MSRYREELDALPRGLYWDTAHQRVLDEAVARGEVEVVVIPTYNEEEVKQSLREVLEKERKKWKTPEVKID